MIKNIIILLIFILTNLLEVGVLKPFFSYFLFLNIAVVVVFATNPKFYTQSLLLALIYGILLNILFASNLFVLPLVFVLGVFILNNLGLLFGERLFHKLVYVFLCIAILRNFLAQSAISTLLGAEVIFAMIYTIIINNILQIINKNVDF